MKIKFLSKFYNITQISRSINLKMWYSLYMKYVNFKKKMITEILNNLERPIFITKKKLKVQR